MKKLKITNSLKYGTYSLIATAVVLAIIIIANLAVAALPSKYTSITNDKKGIYDISDASKTVLSSLTDEVTVYIIATQDQASDYHLMIEEYLKRYDALSDKLSVKSVDPVLRPSFVSSHTDIELDAAYTHLIIVNEKTGRSDVYQYSDIITSEYDPSLSAEEQYYYYMTYGTYKYIQTFSLETCLISGITYVTMERIPVLSYTEGHGESKLDSSFNQIMGLSKVTVHAANIGLNGEIPKDTEVLVIYAPTTDFTEAEIKVLQKYVDGGGNVVLVSGFNSKQENRSLPNLYSFMEKNYGLSYVDALVFEGDTNFAYKYNNQFINNNFYPQMSGALGNAVGSGRILYTNAHPISIAETLPEGVKASPILTTTDKGYIKTEVKADTTIAKGENDPEGKFTVGAEASRVYGGKTSQAMWFSSAYALNIDGTYTSYTQYANIYITVHMMSELTTSFSPETVKSVSLSITPLNISEKAGLWWSVALIGVIPCGILFYGFFIRHRRAKR